MPPVRTRATRGVTAPVRSSPDPYPLYRVIGGEVLKTVPREQARVITGLPDFIYEIESNKFSLACDYISRHEELTLTDDGEIPCLRINHKLIRDLIPGVKNLFQKFADLLKRTLITGKRLSTQETREYETLNGHAKGIMDVLQEIQYSKFKVPLERPIELFERLEVFVKFTDLVVKPLRFDIRLGTAFQKLGKRLCDFRTQVKGLREHLETIELTMELNRNPLPSLSLPRDSTIDQLAASHNTSQAVGPGLSSDSSDNETPEAIDQVTNDLGRMGINQRRTVVAARRYTSSGILPGLRVTSDQTTNTQPGFGEPSNTGGSTANANTGTEPSNVGSSLVNASTSTKSTANERVLSDARTRGDLPPKFFENFLKFERKSPREHIMKNEIPTFSGDDTDPLALTFLDFWELFHETFHKYTYESFPVGERIFALERYTDGAAKQAVQVYRTTAHLVSYVECVRDLLLRWGQTGSAIDEIKAQLTQLSPTGYTRVETDKFLATVQACRLKMVTLGEKPEDAAYCASVQIFNKLPPTSVATFRAMFCKEKDFRSVARKLPEYTYETIRRWIFNNNKEIESAGGAIPSGSQEYLPTSIFSATSSGAQKMEDRKPNAQKRAPITYQDSKPEKARPPSQGSPADSEQKPPTETQSGICTICESTEHRWFECPYPLKERLRFVRLLNRCFNCLTKGHSKDKCKSTKTCRNCKAHGIENPEKKHHTALCYKENKLPVNKTSKPIPKPLDPEREQGPVVTKKPKGEIAMAALADSGEFTPQQLEAAYKTLGIPGPSTQKI